MLHGSNYDDDVTESSIFDLDHAPAPRVSSMMSPQHHSILLQQPLQHPISDSMIGPQPPPPPPITSLSMSEPNTTVKTSSSRLRMSPSLSPRSSTGSIGRSSRKSIVIPVGENNHVVSLPPTAPPTRAFTTGTTSKDSSNTLSGSLLAPITFNRKRLSSFSSIPTVGGSYTYGPSVTTNSGGPNNASISSSSHFHNTTDGTPRIANTARSSVPTNHTTRQRSYSAAAVFSNASTAAVPSHLAHVRSFPPPSTGTALQQRNETTFPSPSLPNNSSRSTMDSLYGTEMYSPSFGGIVPIIRIEETKEPLDGDHSMDDVDVFLPLTDSEYESDIIHERTTDRSDILISDTGFSSESEQPTSSLFLPATGNTVKQAETTLPNSDPTFLYQNDLSGNRNYDFDDRLLRNSTNDATTAIKPVILCSCIPLPHCFSKRRISWDRVASFIAVWSPCFVCFRMEYSTYRAVLFRLNVICGFMAIVQLTASSFHFAVLHSRTVINRNLSTVTVIEIKNENDNKFGVLTNVWNLNGSVILLGLVALVVFVAVVSTIRAIQNVNLTGAIRYYWLILWVMPLQAFWAVSMFDYFHVTQVWIKFWWRDRTMSWYRYQFCHPSTTYNTLCAVPVYSNPEDETAWCQRNYNSTACTSIRDNAQAEVARFLYSFYSCTSAWTILFMISLFLVMKTLESIITSPLVEKSRESSIPSWLMLPMVGCFICGFLFTYSPSSILNLRYQSVTHLQWIAPIFMIAGAMFFTLALLAWLIWTCPIKQTSHKHNKSIGIVVFILISFTMILTMATIFASCIAESLFLGGSISDSVRGPLACAIDQSGSCTYCPDDIAVLNSTMAIAPEDQCPEWSQNDVIRILQSQAKTGANLAVICMLYAIGAFRYGLTVRKHIMNYKIAYV